MLVEELYQQLGDLVRQGYGNREIWIADDEEANGYHEVFAGICTDKEILKEVEEMGMLDEMTSADDIVLLG